MCGFLCVHRKCCQEMLLFWVRVILFQTLRHRTNKNRRLEEQEMNKFHRRPGVKFKTKFFLISVPRDRLAHFNRKWDGRSLHKTHTRLGGRGRPDSSSREKFPVSAGRRENGAKLSHWPFPWLFPRASGRTLPTAIPCSLPSRRICRHRHPAFGSVSGGLTFTQHSETSRGERRTRHLTADGTTRLPLTPATGSPQLVILASPHLTRDGERRIGYVRGR